jgi:glycosyltransferase involved in cell wall biosynthesis
VPVRWALSAVATAAHLVRRRPRVVVVTNPPCPAALVGWALGRALGAVVVLDSHPGAFGAQGDRVARALRGLHRFVTRHADVSIVADESWAGTVRAWGGEAVVVHEAPARWLPAAARRHRRLQVLYVGRFARDEPWEAVLGAAAELPGVDVAVTGDPDGVPLDRAALAPNVRLTGYLGPDDYRRAVEEADCVVTLTTDGGSVMRAACEAVWAGRPLVVSDWPVAREAFPHALHVDNTAASIAGALRLLDAGYDEVAGRGPAARALQAARWEAQRAELLARLGPLPGAG